MGVIVKMPMLNVNDSAAVLVRWLFPDGASVQVDDQICTVETTKSTVDIQAESVGILRHIAVVGETYATGVAIAFLAESPDEMLPNLTSLVTTVNAPTTVSTTPKWTKKAQILAAREGVDSAALEFSHQGEIINEEVVIAATKKAIAPTTNSIHQTTLSHLPRHSWGDKERVLILGGGGGAALVLDILTNSTKQQAVAILDNDPKLTGTILMGTPILGNFDLAISLWEEQKFDALISTVVRDTSDRAAIFERFSKIGIPFTNIVAPSASIRTETSLGVGNLIVHGCYVATGVRLGDNNFLAAGTFVEHHSKIGSHCTFGPRTALSGRVVVADRVKFGMQVAVEPFVEIGNQSVIASGVVLTTHVPANSIVKNSTNSVVRHVKQ